MRRVVGLTRDELETRERVFDGLTTRAVRRSLRALTANVDELVIAAAGPQLSTTPSEPNPTIPAGALGVVTTTWSQEVDETLFPFLVQTFVDAAEDVYAAMPETSGAAPKITYDLAATYLQSAANRLKGIGDVVWDDMRTQLAAGYQAGESINQLASRLRTVAKISEPRALTIARTEVVPAANFGSLQQLKAVGFTDDECRKEWLATEDGRTRLAHLEADGQLVGLNQPFVVDGDFLQVPGDPAGRADNVINCRCSVAYVFDDENDDDEDDDEINVAAGFRKDQTRDDQGRWSEVSGRSLAIHYYAGAGFRNLNAALEKGTPLSQVPSRTVFIKTKNDPFTPVEFTADRAVKQLDRAIDASQLEAEKVLYRGTKRADPQVGDVISSPAYTSTSKSRKRGLSFAGNKGTLWQITAPAGTRGLEIDEGPNTHEEEVLLGRDQRLRVTAVTRENGANVVHAIVEDPPLVADAAFEAKHPRQPDGRFGTKSPFQVLSRAARGKSGDGKYAPGMWGKYGGAGVMMRHVGEDGVARYMIIQNGGNNSAGSRWRWQLPGGARDELETAEQAAARETQEELGFTQEQLDSLELRGAHVVKLPVEGKEPWTYTSSIADAPEAFKPKIDFKELGAARWLTYEQLVEMRGRGRLIAPFAAQLEDIIAKFDEPVVAGFLVTDVTTSQDHSGYYALMIASKKWTAADEAKIKRDSEGKFAKKAGAKIAQHVPIHINTAVIYKKGGHKPNEVIAEKAGTIATDGVAQRLIWHADAKKFMLQAQADNGVDWISVESYSKKAAYDKFSKETGWTKPPAKAESVPTPSLKDLAAQKVADKMAASPIVVKEMTEVKSIDDMTPSEFVAHFLKTYSSSDGEGLWNALSDDEKQKVTEKANEVAGHGLTGPKTTIDYYEKSKGFVEPAPQQPLGAPIHLNTTAIYKTKYADGTVVAEKEPPGGQLKFKQRLVWNGKKKEFSYQEFINGKWVELNAYNKGEAYKEFSKQTGWTHPVPEPPAPIKKTPTKFAATVKVSEMTLGEVTYLVEALTSNELAAKYAPWELDALNEKLQDAFDAGFVTEQEAEILSDKITIAYGQMGLPGGDTFADFKKLSESAQVAWLVSLTPKSLENFNAVEVAGLQLMVDELYSDKKLSAIEYTQISESIFNMTPFKKMTSTIGSPKVPIDDVLNNMTTAEFEDWIIDISPAELGQYDETELDKIDTKLLHMLNDGEMSYTIAHAAGTKVQKAMLPSIIEVPDFDDDAPSTIAIFYDNLTQDDFDNLSASDQVNVAQNASFYDSIAPPGISYSDKIDKFVAGKGDSTPAGDQINYALESAIFMMTQSEYDALSKDEKIKLYEDSKTLLDPTGAIEGKMTSLIKTHVANNFVNPFTSRKSLAPKVSFDWDDNSGPYNTSPIFYEGQVIAYADSNADGSGAQIYDIDLDNPAGYGSLVGTVDFDAGDSIPLTVINLIDTGMLSAPASQPIAMLNVVDDGTFGEFVEDFLTKDGLGQSAIINFMSNAEVDKLTPTEYSVVAAQAAALHNDGFLTKKDFDAFNAKGTKTVVPNVTSVVTPAAPGTPVGSKFFVDVHGKIKQAALISTPASPAPPPSMYKVKTPSQATTMQQTMLSAAGKTWTGVQVSAIKKYGTSVGYRSINAVLRDDPKQLKLFNDAQLADAVKHAVNLQNAMTPLTDDVKLFRGTGAHAFGQNSISANFDELKKLQGTVVTDKGFLSTTVDQNKGVSYDYAKKPVQIVFNAPAGTPALHVDSAIPGHSEHEILLAAGTSYRVDEVRKATDADRIKYGNPNLEHVVEATIVPSSANSTSSPLAAPPAKPAAYVAPTTLTPGTPTSPVSATKVGPIQASDLQWPMKINTATVYKVKYEHGAVVGYHKNVDGSLSRLVWSATNKKFVSQNQKPDGTWEQFAGYGKGETYQLFGKGVQSDKWFAPPPGDSAIGSGGLFGTTSVTPNVSTSAPAPSTVATAPAPPPIKQQKFDVDELQKLHGQIPPAMSEATQRTLFDDFKKHTSVGFVMLSSPETSLFSALHETLERNNQSAKPPGSPKLNMLQLLKIIDEQSTNKANAIAKSKGEAGDLINAQLYEKKLVAWLQTPSGATYATEVLYPPPPAAFDLSGPVNANKTYKSPNFTPLVIDTLHKIKDPAQIGTPDPDATVFTPIGVAKAKQLQAQMLASNPWTTSQKNALTKYTGSYYTTMNPIVRDLVDEVKYESETTLLTAARTAVNIQEGMRPLPENVKVYRKTQPSQFSAFNLKSNASFADIKKLEGKLFIDQAPMSTSIDPNKWSGSVRFEIDLPKGTPVAYVDDISQNKGELEMLLALGLKYRIISVKQEYGATKVHMRVEA